MKRKTRNARPAENRDANGRQAPDPWELVWGQPYIDSETLASAIERDLKTTAKPDFRTRLLVRDAGKAIKSFWGSKRFARWLDESPVGSRIRTILEEDLGEPGFANIRRRLVAAVQETQVRQIFELLGKRVHDRVEVNVAGSIPTLLKGLTARPTEDIDIVNEVPKPIRQQRGVLERIRTEYGLRLGHVQSHYLPAHWENRRQFLGDFGGLRVYLADPYDIFVSKLSSKQEKHKDDLRVLGAKLHKDVAKQRLLADGQAFLRDRKLKQQIEENWRFVYQEPWSLAPEKEIGAKGEEKKNTRRKRS